MGGRCGGGGCDCRRRVVVDGARPREAQNNKRTTARAEKAQGGEGGAAPVRRHERHGGTATAEAGGAKRLDCLFNVGDKRLGKHPLVNVLVVYGVCIVEIDQLQQIFIAERAHRLRRQRHWRERLPEVVGQRADVVVIVGAKVLEQLLDRPRGLRASANVVEAFVKVFCRRENLHMLRKSYGTKRCYVIRIQFVRCQRTN